MLKWNDYKKLKFAIFFQVAIYILGYIVFSFDLNRVFAYGLSVQSSFHNSNPYVWS